MRNKKLCSLLLAAAMLSSVTVITSCEALDNVLRFGEDVFDNTMGAVGGVLDPIVGTFEDLFGGNNPDVPGGSNNGGNSSGNEGGQSQKLTVKSIALDTTKAKMEYKFAEEFTTEGLKITATMSDGSTKEVDSKDCRIVKPDTTKPGTRTVTVVYEGQMARYEIKVNKKVIPQISTTSLLDITAANESVPYRVEAEAIDMATPGVKKAEGITDFVATAPVDADITSGEKYLTGFNVQYNYFGFTFTANQAYESVTLVLRVANSTEEALNAGEMKMFLNFAQDDNGNESGEIALDGYTIAADGAGKWTDIVLRGIDIPAGTNTLTFEVQNDKAFDLDYIDFYVGMRYINSIVEIADTTTIVKDIENFDTEKAFTRADVAAAHGLKDGQLFVEKVTQESPGKTTNGGTSVGAIGKGSQMSTTLRLARNATIRIKMKASSVGKGAYYVADNWKFSIDGVELKMVEHLNIEGGDSTQGYWWDWIYTNIGEYNLSAGDHLFLVEVVSTDCNVDTFEFEVVSLGDYAENGTDLDDQHACESKCPICGKCLDAECTESACEEKCEGHTADESADLSIDGQTDSTATIKAPNFNWANCDIVTRADFIPAVGEGNCGKGTDSIYGFADGSVFRVKLNVQAACTLNIYLEGFGGAAFSNYSWKFGDTVLTPTDNAQLPGGAPAGKVLVGTVSVSEAGVYTFEFTFGVNSDLYNVHFEVAGESSTPEGPSVNPDQPESGADVTIDGAGEYKMEGENVDKSTLVLRSDFAEQGIGFTENWSNDFGSGTCLKGYTNGSILKFTVEVKESVTLALTMRMSHYENVTYDFSNITFKFAGQTLTPVAKGEFGHREASDYWKWVDVELGEVTVQAGTYTFEMNMVSGGNANLDYILLKSTVAEGGEQPEVTPDITITDAEWSYKAEAEELDLSTLIPQSGFAEPKVESFEGGKGLGGIAGGYQTFTVKSEKDVNVALKIAFAKYEGGNILSFIGGVSVNGEALTLTDGTVAPGTSENQWWNVSNVQVATLTLKANTVYTFKINVKCGNLDGYVLDVIAE